MELKDLINIGLSYDNNFKKIDYNFKNKLNNQEDIDVKEWFYNFFNNFNEILEENNEEVKNYNNQLQTLKDNLTKNDQTLEKFEDDDIKEILEEKENYFKFLNNLINRNNSNELQLYEKNEIKKLIKKKNSYNKFDSYKLLKNNKQWIQNDSITLINNEEAFLKAYNDETYGNDFKEYFENDENFNIYFTLNDTIFLDENFIKILDKLKFKKITKIIYIDEDDNNEKSEKNPFRNMSNINRVIKYYDTIKLNFYEKETSWLKKQTINKNFKNQKKLLNFLKIIVFLINRNLILLNPELREDYKLKKFINTLNRNKWKSFEMDSIFPENNEDQVYKDTYDKLNEYIEYIIKEDEDNEKEKEIKDFMKYVLPKLFINNYRDNTDLSLLMYFLHNPKNNEGILVNLIKKYKSII
jgi:hypothetical protein